MDKFVFGITGPTGAGKSTVSNFFRDLGVDVIDADKVARKVTQNSQKCLSEIRCFFGEKVFLPDGNLNRQTLAEIVFSDETKLKLLNEITHKYIKKEIEKEISISDSEILAIDGAVIIGSPVHKMCSMLLVVTAEPQTRIERIMKRDGIDYTMASKRINSQMTNAKYKAHADFVIQNNDGDVGLEENIEKIYNKIKILSKKAATQKAKETYI